MFEKLSEKMVERIRELSLQGLNVRDIAAQVGASIGSISKYRISEEKKPAERPDIKELKKKMYFCPACSKQLFLIQDGSKCYLSCLRCDWCGYLGTFSLPGKIEDLREKFKEV